MLIPFAPGGATDIMARMIEPKMSKALGHQIVVHNRPGAAGNTAVSVAAMKELDAEGVLEKRQTPIALSASPADFDAYVLSKLERWEKVIRDNNVRID